jgi:hypothetical protein
MDKVFMEFLCSDIVKVLVLNDCLPIQDACHAKSSMKSMRGQHARAAICPHSPTAQGLDSIDHF